jgi:NAD(P)-dependent dehydrogenase (short-subunit alcohol dehydrogenase family)
LFSTINILSNLKNNLNNSSSIIFISSISNRTIVDDQDLEYHIIKSGTEQMMRYYAVRFSKKKIRFNCILPSRVIKNSNKKFYFKNKKGIKIRKLIESITPLKRMGTTKDIANLVLF